MAELEDRPKTKVIGYCTDVEGNLEYFERYVDRSKILRWRNGRSSLDFIDEDTEFVFGGDSQVRFWLMVDTRECG